MTVPSGVPRRRGPERENEGPKGQLQFIVHDDVEVNVRKRRSGCARVETKTRQGDIRHGAARSAKLVGPLAAYQGLREEALIRSPASAIVPRSKQDPAARVGYSTTLVYAIPEGMRSRAEADRIVIVRQMTGSASASRGEIRATWPRREHYKGQG